MIEFGVYPEEDYATYDGDYDSFIDELKSLAKIFINRFFEDKKFHCGGKIPLYLLTADSSINLVVSTPFEEGIDLCHEYLEYTPAPAKAAQYPIDWKVLSVIKMLKQVQKVGVPKELQAGMVLLYLKISKGCPVKEVPLNVKHIVGGYEGC